MSVDVSFGGPNGKRLHEAMGKDVADTVASGVQAGKAHPVHGMIVVERIKDGTLRPDGTPWVHRPYKDATAKRSAERWMLVARGSSWYAAHGQQIPFLWDEGDEVIFQPGKILQMDLANDRMATMMQFVWLVIPSGGE